MSGLRIVFMGTPPFALPTLEKIIDSHHQIVGIVTQPDRPKGRGQKLHPPPVKQAALQHHLNPIMQPESLKDPAFLDQLQSLDADAFVIVAYRILPQAVFTIPPKGAINLHPSLLPKYRGAAPINWTIIKGETVTGITTILIRKEVDAGNILLQKEMSLYPQDTAGDLHDRLAEAGADLIIETLDLLERGQVEPIKQDDSHATPAPKITKEMCHLKFDRPALEMINWIHGLSPFPGAFALYKEQVVKFFKAQLISSAETSEAPGTIVKAEKSDLWVACQPGIIGIRELQLEGRRVMDTETFLRGHSLLVGKTFQ